MRSFLFAATVVVTAQTREFKTDVKGEFAAGHAWHPTLQKVNKAEVLRVVLALKRRNMDQLEAFYWSMSDPRSKLYGNRMSAEAVRALITPGARAIGAVTTWLREHGVAEVRVSAHEDYIRVAATAG